MSEINGLIRRGLDEHFPEIRESVPLPFGNPEGNQFFFQSAGQLIIWCRIFSEPVMEREIGNLAGEMQALRQVLRQEISPHIFFPSFARAVEKEKLSGLASRFFEYRCVRGRRGEEILFTECWIAAGKETPQPEKRKPSKHPFLEQTRLKRDELSELIQISLDFRKLAF